MKKRLLTFTLAAVMILSLLTACTANDSKETTAKPDSNQTEETPSPEKSQNKELVDVTLNEVAHSIFMHRCMPRLKKVILNQKGLIWILYVGLESCS